MTQTVTQAYLLGIREGRDTMRQLARDGLTGADVARDALANCRASLATGFSGEMAEFMRGERDFWLNQVRKLT